MMIAHPLSFDLPVPWSGKRFETQFIGSINFLVGPNGSGKTRFANVLKNSLHDARFLSTERLSGMDGNAAFRNIFGDNFAGGFAKNHFPHFRQSGAQFGSGIDTFVLLEERLDLRIQVEATLSHLFNRNISLEWDSGNIIAKASVGVTGASYRLDREECHGIRELLVLLTHLYNSAHPYLIIDEPELNLHPQYQAFFMQEVRRVAGDPKVDPTKKAIFLITHSPFILDFRTVEDVKSVISFDLNFQVPRQLFNLEAKASERLATIVPRLNVHHKQLFFSDSPIFVEGILDAQIVEAIQEARGVSTAGAGSCVIDAGGCEEVNHYLTLCAAFGKKAYFLYDLDSLFQGNLRACLRSDGEIQSFLASAGVGSNFSKYCGELETCLTKAITKVLAASTLPSPLTPLTTYLREFGPQSGWAPGNYAKARVALLTAISRFRVDMVNVISQPDVEDIEGRTQTVCMALKERNVLLLPGGTIERYLPSYSGDLFNIADEAKRTAVSAELTVLAGAMTAAELGTRYGDLFKLICTLPSKQSVNIDYVLKEYLARFIHDLQGAIIGNTAWGMTELRAFMIAKQGMTSKIFSLASFERHADGKFNAVIQVESMLGQKPRYVAVTDLTNAGTRNFTIEPQSGEASKPRNV